MKLILMVMAVISLTGCVGHRTLDPLPEGKSIAILKFGPVEGKDAIAPYWYENDQCKSSSYSGSLGSVSWLTGRETQAPVIAEQPTYVYIQHVQSVYEGLRFCTAATMFIPKAGLTYKAINTPIGEGCITEVYELNEKGLQSKVEQRSIKVTCESF